MKKVFLAALLLVAGVTASSAAEVAFEWDFSKGGEGFVCYDQDGKTPNPSAQSFGFPAENASWIFGELFKNSVAVSNSSHKPMGRAEDWLITPAVAIEEGYSFTFDAMTVAYTNTQKVASVTVKVSTTGTAVEDFTDVLLDRVEAGAEWSTLGVNLSAYAGKTIYIAVINESLSKDALVVDNFFVGIPPIAKLAISYTRIQENVSAGQRISGKVTSGFTEAVTSIDATLTCGDFTTTRSFSELDIALGGAYQFQFNESLPAPTAGVGQVFEVSVVINGKETITETGEIVTQAFQPAKRVVCEEQTGTWCGWCIRGHVYMEKMDEQYPDTYIGIASHLGDVMQHNAYANYTSSTFGGGAPIGGVQRDPGAAGCDPSQFPSLYKTYIKTPALADISIAAEWKDDTKQSILLHTSTTFALSANNFDTRLEYVIVEDDVNQPGNSLYDQANYYAGGGQGAMGGYESKTDPVPAADMYYDDVVRHVITDEVGLGLKGSVPTKIEQGETYNHWAEMSIPKNVFEIDNCEFIVLLLDNETGIILNAAKCSTINPPTSVEAVEADNATRAYVANNGVRVEVNADAQVEVNIYAADGRLVYAAAPRRVNGASVIDCPVAGRGVYLVNVVCDGVAKTHKVVL